MAVLGINSRAARFSHFSLTPLRNQLFIFFERRRRARIDAENGHRRITRPHLRIIKAETQGFPTGYLRAPSGTVKYDREQRELKAARNDFWLYQKGICTKRGWTRHTLITALIFTLAPLWVLGEGVLCCIATTLRGLGHQCCREMVRSDKFVNSTTIS